MINNPSGPPRNDGLPSIAHKKDLNKIAVLALSFGILSIIFFIFYRHVHKPKIEIKPLEETYTVTPVTSVNVQPPMQQFSKPVNTKPELTLAQQELLQKIIIEKQKELQHRLQAPLIMYDNQEAPSNTGHDGVLIEGTNDANSNFINNSGNNSLTEIHATRLYDLKSVITQGTMIDAILETAVDTDLPGFLRAVVCYPVYSADGSTVLIPEGSRLIGQYNDAVVQGQNRILVAWTRVITPEGVSINLASPGVDSLGVAGMKADSVNHHFWQNFGTSLLFSVLNAGASNIGVSSNDNYNAAQAYRMEVANSLSQSASQSLPQGGLIPPTLYKYQGASIKVFVAHDLNFQSVLQQNAINDSSINVF